ncbi:MAG: Tex family protein [Pseudomonadota bacterium]
MSSIEQRIADELNVKVSQVSAAVALLCEGSTVPFIARYRKEKTGGLDDAQLRQLEARLTYLRQLDERKASVLKAVREQGKLTAELERALQQAANKVELEDLYAPFKKKRRTKGLIAREAGLEPLADTLLANPSLKPDQEAAKFLNAAHGITDVQGALDGARAILVERMAEEPKLVQALRSWLWSNGKLASKLATKDQAAAAKYTDYFDFRQAVREMPSHRILALLRGRNDGVLSLKIDVDDEPGTAHPGARKIMTHFQIADRGRAADAWLTETAGVAWKTKLHPSLTTSLLGRLKEQADVAAIDIFKSNLKDLLLAAPAGPRTTMGLDPGIRTGVKVAVVDKTGKVLDTATVYPHEPRNDWQGALRTLADICKRHSVDLIAIGNGTASRETDKLAGELVKILTDLKMTKVMVSEAGASVYSASQIATEEFPDLDVSLRGAVSIARRLQDPLAELVKIEPKAIGVGQYQHDVDQGDLARSLEAAVEDCVNLVGVDVNTASGPLLASVAGLNPTIAQNIVAFRNDNGAFKKRSQIKKVARLGPKAFEQSAGFLRIMNAANPLDASAVHPEAYEVVERIAKTTKRTVRSVVGDSAFLKSLSPQDYADERFGLPTVRDILAELEKPGRDPRPEFATVKFADGVEKMTDLRPGMKLEGVVTNVTAFGAFVDIGVHQDGLVHVSQLADRFVKDPREIVKAGDVVSVRVQDVEIERKRIALTMKSGPMDAVAASNGRSTSPRPDGRPSNRTDRGPNANAHRGSKVTRPVGGQTAPSASSGETALAAQLRRAREAVDQKNER